MATEAFNHSTVYWRELQKLLAENRASLEEKNLTQLEREDRTEAVRAEAASRAAKAYKASQKNRGFMMQAESPRKQAPTQTVPTSSSNSEAFGKMTTREAMLRVTALVEKLNKEKAKQA